MKRLFSAFLALLAASILVGSETSAAQPARWRPAVVSSPSAGADNKGFTILVTVHLPQSKACYETRIRAISIDPHSPASYIVEQRYKGGICTDIITPVPVKQHFDAKPLPKVVTVIGLSTSGKPTRWHIPVVIEAK